MLYNFATGARPTLSVTMTSVPTVVIHSGGGGWSTASTQGSTQQHDNNVNRPTQSGSLLMNNSSGQRWHRNANANRTTNSAWGSVGSNLIICNYDFRYSHRPVRGRESGYSECLEFVTPILICNGLECDLLGEVHSLIRELPTYWFWNSFHWR